MIDIVETAFYIPFHEPMGTVELPLQGLQSRVTAFVGSETVRHGQKDRLVYRFEYHA